MRYVPGAGLVGLSTLRAAELPLSRQPSAALSFEIAGPDLDLNPLRTARAQLSALRGWVYAAVTTIAGDLRSNPWGIWERTGKTREEWKPIDDKLVSPVLRRPNSMHSWGDLVELAATHLDSTGQCFIRVIADTEDSPADGLEIVYPHWIERPMVEDGRLAGWSVQIPGAATGRFKVPAGNMLWIRYPHPLHPLLAASPIEAFALTYDIDLYARAYGAALLKNRQVPNGLLSTEQELSEDQADAILDRWRQRHWQRPGEPGLTGKGVKYQQIGTGFGDLKFMEISDLSADQILAIYKVPRSVLGLDKTVNRATAFAQQRNYSERCLQPRLRRIEEAVNVHLMPRLYRDASKLWFEFVSPVDEDAEAAQKLAERKLKTAGITFNDYRRTLGEATTPDGDVYALPAGFVVVDRLEPGQQATSGAATKAGPEDERRRLMEAIAQAMLRFDLAGFTMPEIGALFERVSTKPGGSHFESLRAEVGELRFARKADALERGMKADVRRLFEREKKAVVKAFRESRRSARSIADAVADGFSTRDWLDNAIGDLSPEWRELLRVWIARSLKDGWDLFGEDFGRSAAFDVFERKAAEFARRQAGAKVAGISETTLDTLRTIESVAIKQGWTVDETARLLAEAYDGFKGIRAETIARTETSNAVNYGKHQSARESAFEFGLDLEKGWVATRDGRTRDSHRHADGQWVDLDDTFDVGGVAMQHPGDPSAPAKEVVKCRCTQIYREKEKKAA